MTEEVKLSKPIAILSARVPPEIYNILEKKAAERGVRLSQLVRWILTSTALGLNEVNISNINQPVIVNMNMVSNEVSPTINNNVGDQDIAKEYVNMLKEDLKKAKEIIDRKNDEIKELKKTISILKKLASKNDVRTIRKVLKV